MQAIVLVGGLGTRMRSVIHDRPKSMASIGCRPFLAVLLDYLESQGISGVILAVGYLREKITGFFGSQYRSTRLLYSVEIEPLGTGGAIAQALHLVTSDVVFVLNGDTFLKVDFADMLAIHQEAEADVTVALRSARDISRYGRAEVKNGRIVAFEEKGASGAGLINCGTYVVSRRLFDGYDLPRAFSFETDFLMPFIRDLRLVPYITDAYFVDIGVPEDYIRARNELSHRAR